jgi:hypothetical protein
MGLLFITLQRQHRNIIFQAGVADMVKKIIFDHLQEIAGGRRWFR